MRHFIAIASFALLFGLSACAGREAGGAAVDQQGMMTIAQRLPAQSAGWVRGRGPEGDAIVGISTGYQLANTRAWATVFVFHPEALSRPGGVVAVAEGPDTPAARQFQMVPVADPAPERSNLSFGVTDAPAQRCAVLRHGDKSQRVSSYACATGVGGYLLRIRVTAPMVQDTPVERGAIDVLVATLAAAMTQAAAGVATAPAGPSIPPAPRYGT